MKKIPNYDPLDESMIADCDPQIRHEAIGKQLSKDIFDDKSKLNKERLEREAAGINHGEIKFRHPLNYKRDEFEDYKNRLAIALSTNGISCTQTVKDPECANLIKNAAVDMIKKKNFANKVEGKTLRLDNVDLASYTKNGERVNESYPVINEFLGHFLHATYYFVKNFDGSIEVKGIEVKKSIILT